MPSKLIVGNVEISRVGYAGVVIYIGRLAICIDPEKTVDQCKIILCTHLHKRHCDIDKFEDRGLDYYSPIGGRVIKPGDYLAFEEVVIRAVHAYNKPEIYYGNPPHQKDLGNGYILLIPSSISIYYMGDTNLVDEVLRIDKDVTLLIPPIGGGCVMTPEEALEAVKSLRPSITIPVHYDDFRYFHKFRDMAQPYTQVIRLS